MRTELGKQEAWDIILGADTFTLMIARGYRGEGGMYVQTNLKI